MDGDLPGWDYDPPEGLSALQAIVGEIVEMYISGDPRLRDAYRAFGDDRDADNSWRSACFELIILAGDGLAAAQGRQLTVARLQGSVAFARELAAEELK